MYNNDFKVAICVEDADQGSEQIEGQFQQMNLNSN